MTEKNLVTIGDDCTLNAGIDHPVPLAGGRRLQVRPHHDRLRLHPRGRRLRPLRRDDGRRRRARPRLLPDEGRGGPSAHAWGGNPAAELSGHGPRVPGRGRPPGRRAYVRREVDELLDRALQQQRFVLVVGPSKAGKSRSASEAVRRRFPASRAGRSQRRGGGAGRARRAEPGRPGHGPTRALAATASTGTSGTPAGSTASCSAGSGGRTSGWCSWPRSTRRGGTTCARTKGELGWVARRILEHATEIQLPGRLSAAERAEAGRLYPEVDLDRGIGEPLAAAPALEQRLPPGPGGRPGRLGHGPGGGGLASHRDDPSRHRLGAPPAVPAVPRGPGRRSARRPAQLRPGAGLGVPARGPGGRPAATGRPATVPHLRRAPPTSSLWPIRTPVTWDGRSRRRHGSTPLATASPEDAMRVGFSASTRGNNQAAAAAWSRANGSGHAEAAPLAAVNLGGLRWRLGDIDGALARVRAGQHVPARPRGAVGQRQARAAAQAAGRPGGRGGGVRAGRRVRAPRRRAVGRAQPPAAPQPGERARRGAARERGS